MKIHFTKKEFKLLLDMVSIAEWVMNAYKIEDDPRCAPYEKLEQKLLSQAREFGFDDLAIYDKELEKFFPTQDFEEGESYRPFIDEYDEEVFWETLCDRLAQRDLQQQLGKVNYLALEPLERLTREDELADGYNDEFATHGLRHLVLANKLG